MTSFLPRDTTKYLGPNHQLLPTYIRNRRPTAQDIKNQKGYYQVPSLWIFDTGIPGAEEIWLLVEIDTNLAFWVQLATGISAATSLRGDDGNIAAPNLGIIDVDGEVIGNGLNAKPLFTKANVANTLDIEIQVSTDLAVPPVNSDDAGIASFFSDQFTVDLNGFVTLKNPIVPGLQTIDVDDFTGPGTDPVVPDGFGQIGIFGAIVAAHSIPLETHSRSANDFNIEAQVSVAAAGSNIQLNGMSHFDNTMFTVDANGFVQLVGGGATGVTQIGVDTFTGPGTDPVLPDGAGLLTITGGQVATGVIGANVIRTDSLAANTFTIEIQRSTAVAAADLTKNGVSHFDSANFTVDANGFVELNGFASFFWEEIVASQTSVINRGYITNAGALITVTLPAVSAVGTVIRLCGKGTGLWRLAQQAGQTVHFGVNDTTTGVGGRLDATHRYDALHIVCTVADLDWTVISSVGNITVV